MRFAFIVLFTVFRLGSTDRASADEPQIAEVIQQALAVVPSIQPDSMRERALELAAVTQVKAGNANGALVTIEGIRSPDRKWVALASWAHARAQKGDRRAAMQMAEPIPDAPLQVEALADIAEVQAREGERSEQNETIQRALSRATGIPKDAARDRALEAIAAVQGKLGGFESGRRTALSIKEDAMRAEVLGDIAEVQALSGDWPGAQTTLAIVQDPGRRDKLLATRIVPALARRADVGTVAAAADGIGGGFYQAMALVRLAKLQSRVGQQQEAE